MTIRFVSLDFIINSKGEMARALEARPLPPSNLDTVMEGLTGDRGRGPIFHKV